MERGWKIREILRDFEIFKTEIINFLKSHAELDIITKNLWIADVTDFYYNTVSAWEMLISAFKGNLKDLNDSKTFLHLARSQLAKLISELKYYEKEIDDDRINGVEIRFERCWNAFNLEFDRLTPTKEKKTPIPKIIKVSKIEYHLTCSVCGKIAVKYKIGHSRFEKNKSLVYIGITHSRALRKELASKLFEILDNEDLSGVHQFMLEHHSLEGLDAYCPDCDKIYCWEHYNAREEYDDGFYDCTCGECPNGHQRMIDD